MLVSPFLLLEDISITFRMKSPVYTGHLGGCVDAFVNRILEHGSLFPAISREQYVGSRASR